MTALTAPHFQNVEAARSWLEGQRWPDGTVCSHCGTVGHSYKTKKPGWYRCAEKECRKDFTVTTGTVMERSHIALNKWLMAFYLMASSKKGISAHQLHRSLDLDYKSAWFMCHRIREAMRAGGLGPIGGDGKTVEADETYYGPVEQGKRRTTTTRGNAFTKKGKGGPSNKRAIIALVERGGTVRSFHVEHADKATVTKIVADNVAKESYLYTDESRLYGDADQHVAEHASVRHSSGEYVRYEEGATVHTNTIENVFSIFKRGMGGIYQHCDEKHLHRYLAEFDFRYNNRVAVGVNDEARAERVVKGIVGKRLTYR